MAVVADELILVVKSNVSQAVAGLEAVERKAAGLGNKVSGGMSKVGGALLPVTGALLAIGGGAAMLGTNFETSMATLQANAGFTAAEIDALEDSILAVSSAFGTSSGSVADAAFMLKSAGMSAGDVEDNLDAVAMAAQANLGEMGDLAQFAGVAFTNFGADSAEAFDILTVAAGNAIVGPEEMIGVFQRLMGPAGAAGQDLEELAKNATVLTNAFGSADQAGTKYAAVLAKTLVPSASAIDALEAIGVSAEDFKKGMSEDVVGTLHELDAAFNDAGMSDDEWIAAIFPDQESFTGAAALLASDTAEAVGASLDDSAGALTTAFDTMAETGGFKMGVLKESAMNALIPLGQIIMEAVIPALQSVTEWIGKVTDWFTGLSDESQKNIIKWAAIVAAIGPVLIIGAKVIKLIQGIGAAMTFLAANPIGLVIVAIAALVAGGIWLYKNWDEVVIKLKGIWEAFSGFFSGLWDTMKGAVSTAWEAIKGIVKGGVNLVIGWVEGLVNGAIGALNKVIDLANKIPGVNIQSVGLVNIPRLATGGTIAQSGMALVGEKGPEYVSLPRGATVHPNGTTPGPQVIHLHNYMDGKLIGTEVIHQTGLNQMRVGRRQRGGAMA